MMLWQGTTYRRLAAGIELVAQALISPGY